MKIEKHNLHWHVLLRGLVIFGVCGLFQGCSSEDDYFDDFEEAPEPREVASPIQHATGDTGIRVAPTPLAYTNIHVETDAGKFQVEMGENIKLPQALAEMVPQYDKAQIVNCITGPNAIFATYSTLVSEKEAYTFYQKESLGMGWEYQKTFTVAGRRMLTAQKANKRLTITFQEGDADRLINVMLSDRHPETSNDAPIGHDP